MTRHLGALAVAGALLCGLLAGGPVLAQKPGGILKMYSIDSPASMSILEESTVFCRGSDDGGVQQPGHIRPACEAKQPRVYRARSGDELVVERGRDRAEPAAAARRQMARRQTVHGAGRQVHSGLADGFAEREAPGQSSQGLLAQSRSSYHQRRL